MSDEKPDYEFVMRVLRAFAPPYASCTEDLSWSVTGDYAPLTFLVDCSDTFDWATADSEPIGPADIDDLERAFADVRAAAGVGMPELEAPMLYCARRRGRRPMRLAYPEDTRLWPLFDAAGPERGCG